MSRNLKIKALVICAVILLAVIGIIGLPRSLDAVSQNVRNNIRLGLDLRGGSHLLLQVQVQDAMKVEADQAIERLKEDLRKANIDYASIDRNDPQKVEEADSIQIEIKGVPAGRAGDIRSLVNERLPNWVLTPVSASDYRLNLRQSELLTIKRQAVERSIQTIEQRINGLGLTEPTIQQHGSAEDLVDVQNGDRRAFLSEQQGGRLTNPRGAAGNQCNFVIQFSHFILHNSC